MMVMTMMVVLGKMNYARRSQNGHPYKICSDSRSKICTVLINGSIFRVKYASARKQCYIRVQILALQGVQIHAVQNVQIHASHRAQIHAVCATIEVGALIGKYAASDQGVSFLSTPHLPSKHCSFKYQIQIR